MLDAKCKTYKVLCFILSLALVIGLMPSFAHASEQASSNDQSTTNTSQQDTNKGGEDKADKSQATPLASAAPTVASQPSNVEAAVMDEAGHYFTTLKAAFESVGEGEGRCFQMLKNHTITNEGLTIPSNRTIELNLNGKVVDGISDVEGTYALITNKGTFTVKDSTDTEKTGSSTGKLTSKVTKPDQQTMPGYASNTITNQGTLTIESGCVENATSLSQAAACYAIDNNNTVSDVKCTIKGGYVNRGVSTAVRVYCNSQTFKNEIEISGGKVEGAKAGLWVQLPGSSQASSPKADVTIKGGTLKGDYSFYDYSHGNSYANANYKIIGGTFEGSVYSYGANIEIAGGTFADDVIVNQKNAASNVAVLGGQFKKDCYNTGAFKTADLIKGGLFADTHYTEEGKTLEYNWTSCIANRYEKVANEDSKTKADYPWMVEKKNPEACIGETTYFTLNEAVAAANEGDVINILRDVELGYNDTTKVSLDINKPLTINGNGYTIKPNESSDWDKYKVGGEKQTYGSYNLVVISGSNVRFNTCTVDVKDYRGMSCVTTKGGQSVEYNYITMTGRGSGHYYGYANNSKVTFDNCTITTQGYGIHMSNEGTTQDEVVINNSTVNGWNSFGTCMSVSAQNTKFGKAEDPEKNGTMAAFRAYSPTTLTNCTFCEEYTKGDSLTYVGLGTGAVTTVKLNGCKVEGDGTNIQDIINYKSAFNDDASASGSVFAFDSISKAENNGKTAETFAAGIFQTKASVPCTAGSSAVMVRQSSGTTPQSGYGAIYFVGKGATGQNLQLTGGDFANMPDGYIADTCTIVDSTDAECPFRVRAKQQGDPEKPELVYETTETKVDCRVTPSQEQYVKDVVSKTKVNGLKVALAEDGKQKIIEKSGIPSSTLEAATAVEVNLDAQVIIESVNKPDQATGSVTFEVKPVANIKAYQNGTVTAAAENVAVENTYLTGQDDITVKLGCGNVDPRTNGAIKHTCQDGTVEWFNVGSTASYDNKTFSFDAQTKTATVKIRNFSKIEVLGQNSVVKVIYYSNNGTIPSVEFQQVVSGDIATIQACSFEKTDCKFTCWNTVPNGTGTSYLPGAKLKVDKNIELYAQWSSQIQLTITDTEVTNNKNYDGTTVAEVKAGTLSGVRAGDDVTVKATANYDGKDVGSHNITVEYTIEGKDAKRYNAPVSETFKNGSISPREVTLLSASAKKAFDGTALTEPTVTTKDTKFVEGEGATYSAFASQTEVGYCKNTFEYTLNAGTNPDNYNITKEYGTLQVMAVYYIGASGNPTQVIDVAGGSKDNGANVQIYGANQTSAQKWTVEYVTDGYVLLRNGSGKVMDVTGAQAKAGTNVWQYEENKSDAQLWKQIYNEDGTVTFESKLDSNLVLDLVGGSTANGTNVQVYTKNGTAAQKFHMYNNKPDIKSSGVEIEDGYYCIQSNINPDFYVDLDGGNTANGTNIHLWSGKPETNDNQIFYIARGLDGFYTITNSKTNKAIDVAGACVLPGTNIHQWENNGTAAQKWNIVGSSIEGFTLQNVGTGLVMDVLGGVAENGQNIQGYIDNGSIAQKWNFVKARPTHVRLDELADANKHVLTDNEYIFVNGKDNTLALDVVGGSKDDGANIQLYTNNETDAQKWIVTHDEKGYITFVNVGSKKVLDVVGAQATVGTNVQQYTSNNTRAQKWIAIPAGDQKVKIVSALAEGLQLGPNSTELKLGTNMSLINLTGDESAQFFKIAKATPKAVFDSVAKSLTFYYDDNPHNGTDKTVYENLPFNATSASDWPYINDGKANEVTSVVIDSTMQEFYGFKSTVGMFGQNGSGASEVGFKNVNSISGFDNLKVDYVKTMSDMFHSFAANSTNTIIALDLTSWNINSLENADNMFACYGQNIQGTPYVYSTNWSAKAGVSAVNMFTGSKLNNADKVSPDTNQWAFANTDGNGCFSKLLPKQVTNITYGDQKVNFVPAFPDTNKSYLKDNKVEFYTDAEGTTVDQDIHNLIYSDNGCTMNELYSKLLVDPSAETKSVKTLYVKAKSGVTFYGVLKEKWSNVFTAPGSVPGVATGYNTSSNFYKFLDDSKGIGTVYFTSKSSPVLKTEGNWDKGNDNCPTLNDVKYSDGAATSAFMGAYGGTSGGVFPIGYPWSSRVVNNTPKAYWWVDNGPTRCWGYAGCDLDSGVVVSLTF